MTRPDSSVFPGFPKNSPKIVPISNHLSSHALPQETLKNLDFGTRPFIGFTVTTALLLLSIIGLIAEAGKHREALKRKTTKHNQTSNHEYLFHHTNVASTRACEHVAAFYSVEW